MLGETQAACETPCMVIGWGLGLLMAVGLAFFLGMILRDMYRAVFWSMDRLRKAAR